MFYFLLPFLGSAAKRNSAPHLMTTYTDLDPQIHTSHVTSTEYELSDFSSDKSSSDMSDEEDPPKKKKSRLPDKHQYRVSMMCKQYKARVLLC